MKKTEKSLNNERSYFLDLIDHSSLSKKIHALRYLEYAFFLSIILLIMHFFAHDFFNKLHTYVLLVLPIFYISFSFISFGWYKALTKKTKIPSIASYYKKKDLEKSMNYLKGKISPYKINIEIIDDHWHMKTLSGKYEALYWNNKIDDSSYISSYSHKSYQNLINNKMNLLEFMRVKKDREKSVIISSSSIHAIREYPTSAMRELVFLYVIEQIKRNSTAQSILAALEDVNK